MYKVVCKDAAHTREHVEMARTIEIAESVAGVMEYMIGWDEVVIEEVD